MTTTQRRFRTFRLNGRQYVLDDDGNFRLRSKLYALPDEYFRAAATRS